MKVLQAMAGAAVGGAEAFFMRLAPALAGAGLEQHVLIRRHAAREAALATAGIRHTALRFGGPLDLVSRWRFRQVVRAERPDIVLTWMSRATAACPPVKLHVARLGGYYDLKRYRRCHHLIANTRGIADWLCDQGWAAERVHVLPNFVEPRAATPATRPDDGRPLLLALGRMHRNKGFDVLIEAMAHLPEARLWLIGDGPERDSLRDLADRHGVADRIDLLPWVADPAPYYAACDVVVCPSRWEPLGNVVLEAWAYGKPVVAARSPGPVELIRDGETGLLIEAEQPEWLAQQIRRVMSNPGFATTLAARGHAEWRARYTEEKVVAAYLDLFRRLA